MGSRGQMQEARERCNQAEEVTARAWMRGAREKSQTPCGYRSGCWEGDAVPSKDTESKLN